VQNIDQIRTERTAMPTCCSRLYASEKCKKHHGGMANERQNNGDR